MIKLFPRLRTRIADSFTSYVLYLHNDVISPSDQHTLLDILDRFKASEAVMSFEHVVHALMQVTGEIELSKMLAATWSAERSKGMAALRFVDAVQAAEEVADAHALDIGVDTHLQAVGVSYTEVDPPVGLRTL